MENKNIDRYILLLKNVTENLKNAVGEWGEETDDISD